MNEALKEKSDEELLTLSIESPVVFEELVNRYQEAFLRKARRIVGNREEIHDIVQDAFTKIYLNAGKFKEVEGGSFNAWGYRILVNTALTYYQKFKKDYERTTYLDPEIAKILPDKTPHEVGKASFFEDQIVAVCSRMPRNLARFFTLYFIEGRSHEDIAKTEGITQGAVKTRISRAKKEFKKTLSSHPVF